MGQGRPRQPTALKLLRGNPGKRAINKKEPQPTPGVPICPSWFDAISKKEWKRVVPELKRMGYLAKVDGGALEACCLAYSGLIRSEQRLQAEGLTIEIEGVLRKNPLIPISHGYMEKYKSFLCEFGLTPSSRSRLQVDKPEKETNPLLAFLKQG